MNEHNNPFNCPQTVYATLNKNCKPKLLEAVAALGPKRITWIGNPLSDGGLRKDMLTCWALRSAPTVHLTTNEIERLFNA